MQDLSAQTRHRTLPPAVEVQNPNYWTAREFPVILFLKKKTFSVCRVGAKGMEISWQVKE